MTQAEQYGAQFADLVEEIVEQAVDEETDEEYSVTLFTFRDGSQMVEYKGRLVHSPKKRLSMLVSTPSTPTWVMSIRQSGTGINGG